MKIRSSFLLILFAIVLLLPAEIFACACCAERGHYSLSYSKPDQSTLKEIQKIRFSDAELYMTAAGEEDIKGLSSIGESYKVGGMLQNNAWKLNFTDDKNKTGMLNLPMPEKMIDYKVDIHDGGDSGAGSPNLYKEWRFKFNVKNGTGIFQNGIKGNTEYFLVLQGRGNVCTSAEDFKNWRLEITGKNASYAFFGKLNTGETAEANSQNEGLRFGNIVADYSGCSCSAQTLTEEKKSGKWNTLNFYSDLEDSDVSAIFNINGKDTKFNLIKKGERPENDRIGTRFQDVYEADNITIEVQYVTTKINQESADYDITLTATKGNLKTSEKAVGSCGC